MPTFATPTPIACTVDISKGRATVIASDRADTVVDARPANKADSIDVAAADNVDVEYADGRLRIATPAKGSGGGAVDIVIELPAGSSLKASSAAADIRAEGTLGDCELSTASGLAHLDRTGTVRTKTSDGHIVIEQVTGPATISTSSGQVRIREIGAATEIKTASGDISIGRADAGVTAKSANGSIRVDDLRAPADLMTADGEVRIGIPEGTAAWVDAHSRSGSVRNALDTHDTPAGFGDTIKVRARTDGGDIVISRAAQNGPAQGA